MCSVAAIPVAIAVMDGMAKANQGQADAATLKDNARRARLEGNDSMALGQLEAGEIRSQGHRLEAQQRVGAAANNVTGATVDNMFATTAVLSELDSRVALSNAMRRKYGLDMAARDMDRQAQRAKRAGLLGAFGAGMAGVGAAVSGKGSA